MKRILFYATGATLVLLAAPGTLAQTGTARGRVMDEQGQPLVEAKIDIDYQGGVTRHIETKTNKKGEYIQVGLPPGTYRFTASKEGYQSGFVEQRVSLGDATVLPDMKLRTLEAARKAAGGGVDAEKLKADFGAAAALLKDGKLDEAEASFKAIAATTPSIPEVHYNLGLIASRKKDWPAAEASFKRAIELRPEFGDAYSQLADVYTKMGQPEKANEIIQQAAEGGDPAVLFSQAAMLLNAGKLEEAEAAFKKVEAADPTNSEVHFHLATIALNQGKTDECVARLEKYVASSPKNAQNLQTAQGLLQALKKK
ncbi:MAG TPA: tetratricopeptide repeat protein [Vicinamibacteria bacterium]|nr:tetratricopeptide repeat protein [Vicinamibacteria bacterium]